MDIFDKKIQILVQAAEIVSSTTCSKPEVDTVTLLWWQLGGGPILSLLEPFPNIYTYNFLLPLSIVFHLPYKG